MNIENIEHIRKTLTDEQEIRKLRDVKNLLSYFKDYKNDDLIFTFLHCLNKNQNVFDDIEYIKSLVEFLKYDCDGDTFDRLAKIDMFKDIKEYESPKSLAILYTKGIFEDSKTGVKLLEILESL